MDIAIHSKKSPNYKRLILLLFVTGFVLWAVQYLWYLGQADFAVDSSDLVFGEVQRGTFSVSVRGTGLLVPDNIQWLSAGADAKVERLVVKAGNVVRQGDLIVVLSNPLLVQELAEAKWELDARQAESMAARTAQESELLEQKSRVLDAKLNYESSLLLYNAQVQLSTELTGAVSRITYQRTLLETEQLKQRWLISQEQQVKMRENLVAQNNARVARLNQTRKKLERFQSQVDDLQVTASIDSVVLEMPLEPGQRIMRGANIAKLAEQGSLIAELQVPEIQVQNVSVGQRVIIDTRNSVVDGYVIRVDPTVINGNVQVDIAFRETLPADARADLSVDGEIIITEIADTLYVDRPLFAQSRSHLSFYKLVDNGQFAQRVAVQTGHGSISKIQILDGLEVGHLIVTSDPTRFSSYKKIRINQSPFETNKLISQSNY